MLSSLPHHTIVNAPPDLDFAEMRTNLSVNGRYWNSLSAKSKLTYMIAVTEGMTAVVHFAPKQCKCFLDAALQALHSVNGGEGSSYLDVICEVDSFYSDPARYSVPVIAALEFATLKLQGAERGGMSERENARPAVTH